jgi:hypothetical protein
MRRLMLALCVALAVPLSLPAYTFHVHAGDAIQDSIDAASVGDSVVVDQGVYHESIDLKWGVTVCSTHGSNHTTIMAPDSTYVVSLLPAGWPRPGLHFGGADSGFKVIGGTESGVYLCGTWEPVWVEDLYVRSAEANKALHIDGCDSLFLRDVRVYGYTYYGVFSYSSWFDMDSVHVYSGSAEGIYVEWGNPGGRPIQLRNVTVEDQENGGVFIRGTNAFISGGDIGDCPWGVNVSDWYGILEVICSSFLDCSNGVSAGSHSVAFINGCTFERVYDTGVSASSYSDVEVRSTTFEDVYNTGVRIESHSHGIIGDLNQSNVFDNIDGIGVHLADTATATISYNNFYGVLGSAIQCETGTGGTIIENCVLDGSGGCFEGIHTSGLGTLAKVRSCQIVDYNTGVFPVPRAVDVFGYSAGTTADLGHDQPQYEWGNYAGLGTPGQIPNLYAQRNYWGAVDPWIAGAWKDYVVWEPPLEGPPGAPPAPGGDSAVPQTVALRMIHPNPALGAVRFSYAVPAAAEVELTVWDVRGHLVRTLVRGATPAGAATVEWDGTDEAGTPTASGAYVCRLRSTAGEATRRFVFMR